MASYIGIAPPTQTGIVNRYQYTGDGSTVLFSGNDDNGAELRYTSTNPILVYLNGVQLLEGTDYTKTSNTSVTFASAPALNDTIEILTFGSFDLNAPATIRTDLELELSDGEIFVGSSSDQTSKVTPSGDITISNTGVTTIGAGSVSNAKLANSSITIAGDSGSDGVSLGETLTIAGGTGLTSTGTSNTLTLNIDSTVATLTGTQTLTNKTIDTANNTITIAESDISDLGSYIENVVEDTTPQLGGNLDLNSSDITGTGNIDIDGDVRADTHFTSRDLFVTLSASGTGGSVYLRPNGQFAAGGQTILDNSGNLDVSGTVTSDGLTVDTNTLYVDSTNNLVGIRTSSPAAGLDISTNNTNGRALQLRSGDAATQSDSSQIIFSFNGNSYDSGGYAHSIRTRHNSQSTSDNAIDFWLWDQSTDTSSTLGSLRVMTIDGEGGGRVGIGTSSPSTTLDVSGTVTATTFSGSGASLTSIPNSALDNSSITIAGDSGSDGVSLGETLTIAGGTGLTSTGTSNTMTIALDNTAVTAGSYGSSTAIPTFTVDAQGRLTAASTTAISSDMSIAGDSGTDTITVGTDTFTIAGGTGLTSTATTDTITLNIDSTVATLTGSQTLTNKTLGATTIAGHLIPDTNITYDLGSSTFRFRDLYLSGTSIELGSATITASGSSVVLPTGSTISGGNGDVTDLNSAQTLTNKTISGSSNTLSNIGNASLTNSSITVTDGSTSTAVSLGGTITIQGTTNEIEVSESSGTVTIGLPSDTTIGNNLTIAGNLTVNGTTTTLNTTNTTVTDNLLELNSGVTSNANDSGILIERGSTGDNAIIAWDESADKFTLGTTTATASDTGNLTITTGTLVANLEATTATLGGSDIISTDNTKTLTNKTINTASNTITIVESDISDLGAYLENVSEDTTPQLGGNLDLNSNDITGTGNLNITGNVSLTGTVDGRDVATDGTKLDGIATSATANPNAIDNVVEDTTPQLGGDLSTNGNDINFGDNDKAQFGASQDLQIYHDGNHSYIDDVGTGSIFIRADDYVLIEKSDGSKRSASFNTDDAVILNFNNNQKFTTTSSGIDVTGTVVSDGLTVDTNTLYVDSSNNRVGIGTTSPSDTLEVKIGSANTKGLLIHRDNASGGGGIDFSNTSNTVANINAGSGVLELSADPNNASGSSSINFKVDASEAMRITSAGNVGIGESSPDTKLHITGDLKLEDSVVQIKTKSTSVTGRTDIQFGDPSTDSSGGISYYHSDDSMRFTRPSEVMRIDSSGNVGIGTSSPSTSLDVSGTVTATAFSGDGSGLTGVASDVVDDTTPQLGGDLDLNSNDITGTGNININGFATATVLQNPITYSGSVTIDTNQNAMVAGPFTVTGTLTIPSGSTFVVV